MADYMSHPNAAGSIEDWNTAGARVPRFYRHPGVQFAVVIHQLALFVYDEAGVPGGAERVGFHDGEAAPDFVFDAGRF
jgi:hypothetical protein